MAERPINDYETAPAQSVARTFESVLSWLRPKFASTGPQTSPTSLLEDNAAKEVGGFLNPDELLALHKAQADYEASMRSYTKPPALGDDPLTNALEALRALKEGKSLITRQRDNWWELCDDPDQIATILESSLKAAGKDASAVFPVGQKTTKEAQATIDELVQDRYLQYARSKLRDLQEGISSGSVSSTYDEQSPENISSDIRRLLALAHKDASALDPYGHESIAEMERQIAEGPIARKNITEAEKQSYIAVARNEFEFMALGAKDGSGMADTERWRLQANLARAGVDASVLDASGKHSASEMTALLDQNYRQEKIASARFELQYIQHSGIDDPSNSIAKIRKDLADADATLAALDPEGKRSAGEMEIVLKDAAKWAKIESEREHKGDLSYEYDVAGMTIGEWENNRLKVVFSKEVEAFTPSDTVTHGLSSAKFEKKQSAKE